MRFRGSTVRTRPKAIAEMQDTWRQICHLVSAALGTFVLSQTELVDGVKRLLDPRHGGPGASAQSGSPSISTLR